ncbi:MAG: four helix bundle protein [Chloroflexales bacterium]
MQAWDVEMQRRTTAFANAILDSVDRLPSTRSSNIIANQVGRSATSVMANHAESARPKSVADKIAKQGTGLQELQETRAWLVLLQQRGYLDEALANQLIGENDERIGGFTRGAGRFARADTRPCARPPGGR